MHKDWIESQLGIGLSAAVILVSDISFCDAALPRLIGYSDRSAPVSTAIARLTQRLQSVVAPPCHIPLLGLSRERAVGLQLKPFMRDHRVSATYSLDWIDGPVAIQIRDFPVPQ